MGNNPGKVVIFHSEAAEDYAAPGHPERPARVSSTRELLKRQSDFVCDWRAVGTISEESILRIHDSGLLENLKSGSGNFDADTARLAGICDRAKDSAAAAIRAMEAAKKGEIAFSLMRPPGHHATRSTAMGFCYLNSIAIACGEARASGVKRVGVLDFDVHHGNGTEDIFLDREGYVFASIHQSPCYPGSGTSHAGKNCFNYPLPPLTARNYYRETVREGLSKLASEKVELIGVSAGFDAYARDPLAQELLEADDFYWIGQQIRQAGIPFFSVLEGGYSNDLPLLVKAYLQGIVS
ncbi:MAG: histone deacetylase superfamily [Verrucomicrobiales bacterium]|nr:histone deacetylase superfamily [Verrucomicrobiales bacterium]